MLLDQEFVARVELLTQEYKTELCQDNIFTQLISNSPEHYKLLQKLKKKKSTTCGKTLKTGNLVFLCLTCSNERPHLYCEACFDITIHQGHKCHISKEFGFCDCGDESLINPEGFCSKHRGFKNFDLNQEMVKIPDTLREKLQFFFQQICLLYLEKMKIIQTTYKQFSNTLIQIYDLTIIENYETLSTVIENKFEIKNYYIVFQQCYYLYKLFFQTIEWLITERLPFIILINQILQIKVDNNSSILENMLESQLIIETQGPADKFYILQNLFNKLQQDSSFGNFLMKIILSKLDKLRIFIPNCDSNFQQKLNMLLQQLVKFQQQKIRISEAVINQWVQYFEQNAFKLQKRSKQSAYPFESQLLKYDFSYGKENLTNYLFSASQFCKVMQVNTKLFSLYHKMTMLAIQQPIKFVYILQQHHTNLITNVIQQQIENSFSKDGFQTFSSSLLNFDDMRKVKLEECVFSIFIEAWKQVQQKKKILIEHDYQKKWVHIFQDLTFYIDETAQQVFFFKENFEHIIQQQNSFYRDNLIHVLLISCYAAIKDYKNTQRSIIEKIQESCDKYIKQKINTLKKKQIIDRYSRILLNAFKQDTILDKLFIYFLSIIYNLKQFQQSNELLNYFENLFQVESDVFQQQLYKILERCVVSLQSMKYHKNSLLHKAYSFFGGKILTQPYSFDISFIQLYLYFYKAKGLMDLRNIITQIELRTNYSKQLKLPDTQPHFLLECSILQRIFGGDLDMLNICGEIFSDLPQDLHLSFGKLMAQAYVEETFNYYDTLKEYCVQLNVQINFLRNNNYKTFLSACTIEKSNYLFRLNECFKPSFDKNLLSENQELLNNKIELLAQKHSNSGLIQFGDGIQWDIQYFSSNIYRKMLKEILQFYCQDQFIQINLSIIKEMNQYFTQTCQLLHTQFVALKYFQPDYFEQKGLEILELLKTLHKQIKVRNMKQVLNLLIDFLKSLLQKQQIQQNKNLSNQQLNKQRFKEKFKQKQQQTKFQENIDAIEQEVEENEEEQNICAACKQKLNNNDSFTPVLISKKPNVTSVQILPSSISNFLKSKQNFSLGIKTCKHEYHQNCLREYHYSLSSDVSSAKWVFQDCPVCKVPCNFMLPLNTLNTSEDAKSFYIKFHTFCLLELECVIQDDFIEMLYQLLFELLVQLLQNQKEFQQMMKYKIVKSIFNLIPMISKLDLPIIKKTKNYFNTDYEQSFTLSILNLVENLAHEVIDENQFKEQMNQTLLKCQDQQIRAQLQESFSVHKDDQLAIPTFENEEIKFFNQQFEFVQNQIQDLLGSNFDVFHKKYFPKVCDACGFFNSNQKGSYDSYLCLFCLKIFCAFDCKEKKSKGNLNKHAQNEHQGASIYVRINSGECIFIVSPITVVDSYSAFANRIFFTIKITDENVQWENYELFIDDIKTISKMIATNDYHKSIKCLMDETEEEIDNTQRY